MSEDHIQLNGMVFFGHHGTLAPERELGQRFIIDIDLQCDLRPAARADDLAQALDYSAVYRSARAIVTGPPVRLTETLAERIADAVLTEYAQVEAVRVRVTKPNVRLEDTVLSGSTIAIVRRRDGGG